jgi:uncharacterized radical SAM superfamily Fe-S cluster-containing enzyme
MGIFDKLFNKDKGVNNLPEIETKVVEKVVEKGEYDPQLGEANRYDNATRINSELAEKINKNALSLVNYTETILIEVENDPGKKNVHSKISGNRWNIDFIRDQFSKLHDLYGDSDLESLKRKRKEIPDKVINFEERVKKLINF